MKKLLLCAMLIFTLSVGTVKAWDYCFYDETYYVTSLYFSIYPGGYLYGAADYGGFYGAITGVIAGGRAYFAIDYIGDNGLRFYDVDLSTRAGETWGVYSDTGEFYDTPHAAQLQPCGPGEPILGDVSTGAVERLQNQE